MIVGGRTGKDADFEGTAFFMFLNRFGSKGFGDNLGRTGGSEAGETFGVRFIF